jgi:hypothetical protein
MREKRVVFRVLGGETREKFWRLRGIWEDNINMDL